MKIVYFFQTQPVYELIQQPIIYDGLMKKIVMILMMIL